MTSFALSAQVRFALIASFGGFVFGFDASVISGALGFITTQFSLSEWQQGMLVSSPTLGAIIASFFAGFLSDHFGRRNSLIGAAGLYLVSAFLSFSANSYEMLVFARFIGGLAFCSLLITPMYIAEISLPQSRGKLVSINQLSIVVGLSVSYFSNYFLLNISERASGKLLLIEHQVDVWRAMLGLELFPAFLWLIGLFFIPKSPRWLLLKQAKQEAKHVLDKLYTKQQARELLSEMDHIPAQFSSVLSRLSTLFAKKHRFILMMGLLLAIAQQISGINVIFFYAPVIFEQSGIGTNSAFAQAAWIGVINVLFTFVAIVTIDHFGRKPLLIIGMTGVCVSMLLCSYGFNQARYELKQTHIETLATRYQAISEDDLSQLRDVSFNSDTAFKAALVDRLGQTNAQQVQSDALSLATEINALLILFGIMLFVASFAMSLGPVMWVFFSEIFPSEIRGIGISFLALINGLVSFLVQLVFPWELANLGAAITFLIYGVISLVALVTVTKYLPETKGQSLEKRLSNSSTLVSK